MKFTNVFTNFIHDWPLPTAPISESFVVMGCSHTTGVGLDREQAYPSLLSRHYKMPVYNLAVGNGNADICRLNFFQLIESDLPKFLVIQWPNPVRKIIWTYKNNEAFGVLQNITNGDVEFQRMAAIMELQFYWDWISEIVSIHATSRRIGLPVVHIYLDQLKEGFDVIFQEKNLVVHWDEKIPGKTWFFDNGAADGMHHSAWCHEQWVKRLIPLIDEVTTR